MRRRKVSALCVRERKRCERHKLRASFCRSCPATATYNNVSVARLLPLHRHRDRTADKTDINITITSINASVRNPSPIASRCTHKHRLCHRTITPPGQWVWRMAAAAAAVATTAIRYNNGQAFSGRVLSWHRNRKTQLWDVCECVCVY